MSYSPFTEDFDYTKHWTSAEDFQTFEAEESQVRADMQELYTQIADALNTLTAALKAVTAAGYLGFTSNDVNFNSATNLKDALENLSSVVSTVSAGNLVDDCIATSMIQDDAVTGDKIDDSAVGASQLADEAVTTPKLADEAVTTAKIDDGAVTPAKTDFTGADLTIGANGKVLNLNGLVVLNANSYGDTEPTATATGQVFFKKA